MKRQRKTLLFLFSFVAVFFSFSIDADTKSIQINSIDNLYVACNDAKSDNPCVDHEDEDQINLCPDSVFTENPVCQISIPHDNSGAFDFGLSVWQPPRFF